MNYNRLSYAVTQLNRSYLLTALVPNDRAYVRFATRDALYKYWVTGMRKYTKWDADW